MNNSTPGLEQARVGVFHRSAITRLLAQVVSCMVGSSPLFAYGPGCPAGISEPMVLNPATSAFLSATIRWCAVAEAPSVAMPSLVCESDFKTMLWRRHERPSDNIWIPQCNITLRSAAGFAFHENFKLFGDPDASPGDPGDLVISDPGNPTMTEVIRAWLRCDAEWNAMTPVAKGVIAISAHKLINHLGAPASKGAALSHGLVFPYIALADPSIYCQLNERAMAQAFGKVINLSSAGVAADNLMRLGSSASGATLTLAQCNDARAFMTDPANKTALGNATDEPVNRIGAAFDRFDRMPPDLGELDILKTIAIDTTPSGGDLMLCIGSRASDIRDNQDKRIDFWFLLDVDNSRETGVSPRDLIRGDSASGIDVVVQVSTVGSNAVGIAYVPGDFEAFVPVALNARDFEVKRRAINLELVEPLPDYKGPTEFPVLTEVDVRLSRNALRLLGLDPTSPEGLFQRGLRVQSISAFENFELSNRTEPAVIAFPKLLFPRITMQTTVKQGERVNVTVERMPRNAALKLILGPVVLHLDAQSNDLGEARFEITIPSDFPPGPALVTLGVTDPGNAATADAVVNVEGIARPLAITRSSTGITLEWGGRSRLQHAFDIRGPWLELSPAASPFSRAIDAKAEFFRLQNPAAGFSEPNRGESEEVR